MPRAAATLHTSFSNLSRVRHRICLIQVITALEVFTKPIHLAKATDFPESATHAIDFGPGGASGIGPLTAKYFEGRGVRVIAAGDSRQGRRRALQLDETSSMRIGEARSVRLVLCATSRASSSSIPPSLVFSTSLPSWSPYMEYYIDNCDPNKGATYKLAKEFNFEFIKNTKEVLGQPPVYKDVTFPTVPHTEVTAKGDIVYAEVVRERVGKLGAYVEEMAGGGAVAESVNIQKVQDDVSKLWTIVNSLPEVNDDQRNRIKALYDDVVRSLVKSQNSPEAALPPSAPRSRRSSSEFLRPQVTGITPVTSLSSNSMPLLHLKRRVGNAWEYSSNLTGVYLDILHEIATSGTSFKDKNAPLTGVGCCLIGIEVVKSLLAGGAHVVITTSSDNRKTVEHYQSVYHSVCSRGSSLTVVPFNQASKQDVEALVDYIYSAFQMDLDYILPFAGIHGNGREIDGLDDRSELAHLMMLANLLRILGVVKNKKASCHFVTRPTQVILPLSPNHSLFGNDGLYSESKISVPALGFGELG
ncbi:hypothetical protein NMY22_g19933 [Coprinellus aureogranulatus]|nr:hypothetical protein NMY22_g19933 [Coprinellus aureogranulatus]